MDVLSAGLQTSIQDLGRKGSMHLGIAHTGAMDPVSAQLANFMVGNQATAPVLEITLTGPRLKITRDCQMVVCGARFKIFLNQKKLKVDSAFAVKAGDTLTFGKRLNGARAYLAVDGGFDVHERLGSFATHLGAGFGGFSGRALVAGDCLPVRTDNRFKLLNPPVCPSVAQREFCGSYLLRVTRSVESDDFSDDLRQAFCQQKYRVSPNSNRLGIRLTGQPLVVDGLPELLSGGMIPGAIQIPPGGQPIIAGIDGPTVGGYPRIANVILADLPVLGQLLPGDRVSFAFISPSKARQLYSEQQALFAV